MQPSFRERRVTPRSRVFFGGEILIDSGCPAVECHVKNVSRRGAGIVVPGGEFLPDQIDLVIRKTNERHHAVVTWRNGRQFGIAYRARSSVTHKVRSTASEPLRTRRHPASTRH
jgi:PilZ domain-containing protein